MIIADNRSERFVGGCVNVTDRLFVLIESMQRKKCSVHLREEEDEMTRDGNDQKVKNVNG